MSRLFPGCAPTDALAGYRAFTVWPGGGPAGYGVGHVFVAEPNVARHDRCADTCPGDGCRCGFNAFDTAECAAEYAAGSGRDVVIVGWGDVQVHENGWRSQFAQVVALQTPGVDAELLDDAKLAAARVGVPLVAAGQIETVASEHGRRVRPAERRDLDRVRAPHRAAGRWKLWSGLTVLSLVAAAAFALTVMWTAPFLTLIAGPAGFGAVFLFAEAVGRPDCTRAMLPVLAGVVLAALLVVSHRSGDAKQDALDRVADRAAELQRDAVRSGRDPDGSAIDLLDAHPGLARMAADARARVAVDVSRVRGEVIVGVRGPDGLRATRRVALEP